MARPTTTEVTSRPAIRGSRSRPLLVAEAPWTVCWYSGRNVTAPKSAKPTTNPIPETRAKLRLVNSFSDRTGSAARRSTTANAAQASAEPVDAVLGAVLGQVQLGHQDQQGEPAERQVDVEGPAPRQVVGDEATDQRAADHGDGHDAGEHALVLAPLPGRHQVADDGHHAHNQAARTQTLDRPEPDELHHVLRHARQRRPDQEQD